MAHRSGMTPTHWRAHAFAKVNLGLIITARRPDGYHDIRTRFQSIELHDTIRVDLRVGEFRLRSSSGQLPLGPENLVWQAAEAIWRESARPGNLRDAEVSIEKRVPIRAGLGGGSADAAATLVLLAEAWGCDISASRLAALAPRIGADVPFFLQGGCAVGSGRGDLIEPLDDRPPCWVVLVLPRFGVSTVGAFGWFDESVAGRVVAGGREASMNEPDPLANDLEAPVAERHPSILEAKHVLLGAGADGAAMSGSGSAVYGLFADEDAARETERRLRADGWSARLTRTLSRAEYATRAAPIAEPRSAS